MGMGVGVSEYSHQGNYGMQAVYSEASKNSQYAPDQPMGSQLQARAQHAVLGIEERFAHMSTLPAPHMNGASGGSTGAIDPARRTQHPGNANYYQSQNIQRTSHQQMQMQMQLQQQHMQHDVRHREL